MAHRTAPAPLATRSASSGSRVSPNHGCWTTLTGAQPAVYTSNGKTVRALAQENDKAFALLNALDANERKQAILNYEVHDLVLGPGHAGETIQPEGLTAAAMNEKQRAILLDVISEWVGIVNDAYAIPRMAEIKTGLDENLLCLEWTDYA